MTDTLAPTPFVDPDVASAMVLYERINPLKDALGLGKLSDAEVQLFAMVALHTGLDPFSKQIYAIKRGGKVTHQTGIDGYRSTAARTAEYAGSDEATFEECDCGDKDSPPQHPAIARVIVHRLMAQGHMIDQPGIARWHELKPTHTKGEYGYTDDMWWAMPYNQLAKCAEANGLRKAFPRVLGGLYITEEMQQAETIEGTAVVLPTAAERIAERRRAIESPEPAGATETAAEAVIEGTATEVETCGDASPYGDGTACILTPGHKGNHKAADRSTWNPR